MKTKILAVLFGAALAVASIVPVLAEQPENPGCFGRDRAAWLHANSGREWGAIASDRAGDNGTINQAYKTWCGGDPTP